MRLIVRLYHQLGISGRSAFLLTALIYILLFSRRTLLDITAQVQTLLKVCGGEVALPPTFLFYGLTWLAALGQCDFVLLMGAAVFVLAGLVTAKWWVTRRVFENYFSTTEARFPEAGHCKKEYFGWIALALAFVCSLPTPDWWLHGWYIVGQPSPNYWMNGTLLASWPFAIVLFWQSYRQLLQPEVIWWRWMLLWLLLLVVSKPSYAFVFAVVYPVFLVGRHGFIRSVRWHLMPFGILALLLAAEFWLVFLQKDSVYVRDFNRGVASGVTVQPFHVWGLWSSNIPLSILAGVAFPVYVAAAFWRDLKQRLLFWYAWAGFFAALFIYVLFVQKGEEHYTAAFRFQNYIAAYILFVVSALFVWEKIRTPDLRPGSRVKWATGIFLLHLLSGLVYLGKMWWTKNHY